MKTKKLINKICSHNFIPSKKTPLLLYCLLCSSLSFLANGKSLINAVKPSSFNLQCETPPILTELSDFKSNYLSPTSHKKEFYTERQKVINQLKKISTLNNFSLKSFFLAVSYFDIICNKINDINIQEKKFIGIICLILAGKFSENGKRAAEFEAQYRPFLSPNYASNELYILKLLDYNLNITTCYDVMIDIMEIGFLFENERFSRKKMNFVYGQMEKMIFAFSESKNYVNMNAKEIAFGIIGFVRGSLELEPFSEVLKSVYDLREEENGDAYLKALENVRKCLKVKQKEKNKENKNSAEGIKANPAYAEEVDFVGNTDIKFM